MDISKAHFNEFELISFVKWFKICFICQLPLSAEISLCCFVFCWCSSSVLTRIHSIWWRRRYDDENRAIKVNLMEIVESKALQSPQTFSILKWSCACASLNSTIKFYGLNAQYNICINVFIHDVKVCWWKIRKNYTFIHSMDTNTYFQDENQTRPKFWFIVVRIALCCVALIHTDAQLKYYKNKY